MFYDEQLQIVLRKEQEKLQTQTNGQVLQAAQLRAEVCINVLLDWGTTMQIIFLLPKSRFLNQLKYVWCLNPNAMGIY